MITKHPFPLVKGPYNATSDLLTTLILWAAAMVSFKTSPNRPIGRATAYGVEVGTEMNKIMTKSTINNCIIIIIMTVVFICVSHVSSRHLGLLTLESN